MLIKYDALSVEAMDKIHICLNLLSKYSFIEKQDTLKETYEKYLGIYNLERNDPKMWEMVWNHKILSLFQMEKQSGIRGIDIAKPANVNDLSVLNSVIRLMAPDKNSKTPLETWSDYRKDINIWIKEMENYGLTKDEIDWLSHHSAITNGICESQEGLMSLVQEPQLGGNTLTFADKCRKGIAKKQGKLFQECENIFYENIKKNGCSEKLAHYVWDILLKVQRGYSFNRSHCLAYSLVALQEMNLAYKYPIIFWDCACLISNSSDDDNEEIVSIYEKEDTENYFYEDLPDRKGKKKIKNTDYAKVAKAIGEIVSYGIEVSLININTSDYNFEPDVENNRILYGLKALSNINEETVEKIKSGRPYKGIKDFIIRCPLTKIAMINLIKAGAFDEIETDLHSRKEIMAYYISKICEPKKKLSLQNFNGLIQHNIIPKKLELNIRVFNFTKFLKQKKWNEYYVLNNEICIQFLEKFFPEILDNLETIHNIFCLKQNIWEKYYQKSMDEVREWIKENHDVLLKQYNEMLFMDYWTKYAIGTISHWEMDVLAFYHSDHELKYINNYKYNIKNFNEIKPCEVDYYFKRGGIQIPIYKLSRIAGTVLNKDDNKATINLLTTTGVVPVRFNKEYYSLYNKQISQVQPDKSKKVLERSWFKRGTMLLITGYKKEDMFVEKTYANSNTHGLYKITDVIGDEIKLQHERVSTNGTIEEDYEE